MNSELQMKKDENLQEWMGKCFDTLLKDQGVSKRKMASILEVSPSPITRMCSGTALIMHEKLDKLHTMYHVDMNYFISKDLSCTMYMKDSEQQRSTLDFLVDNIMIEMEKADQDVADNSFCRICNSYLSSRGLAMTLSPLHSQNDKEVSEKEK